MKILIDALKEKCYSKKELVEILKRVSPKKSHESLRKRCERFLRKFEKFGLVEKRGDKYCWYMYVNRFKDRDYYPAKLKHSRDLIPALREIAKITRGFRYSLSGEKKEYVNEEDMKLLVEGAENHLKSYPKIWKLVNCWKEKEEEAAQKREMFTDCLMEKLKEEIGEPVKSGGAYAKRLNIPLLIYAQIRYNYQSQLQIKDEEIWLGGNLVAKGKHFYRKIDEFIKREREDKFNIKKIKQIEKIENKAFEVHQTLQQEIQKLILKIESGEPLLGGCETCPKIYFSEKVHKW